jgi:phenylacetate-CoA ligase
MKMMWNREYETMPRDALAKLQFQRLQWTLKWAYERVPFYQQKLHEVGIAPKDIKSLEDLAKLPFTDKEDLKDNYPFGLFAVPMDKIVRVHSSSGTTGKPIVVGYTKGDINTWSELIARIVTAAGVTSEDIAQICFGYGLFTGGFGLHYGLERVGATVIPSSSGNTERQLIIMKDFGTTALISTPSYALYIGEVAKEMGIKAGELKLRVGLFGAEPSSEGMRREIESKLGLRAMDNYGLTEVIGPGVSGECLERNGLHINEDHFIVEVIDQKTGEALTYGEEGELVFTSLTKEACPIIRFRTKDLSHLMTGPCACGRTFVRMAKVHARTDDMLIIRGVNVFPSQIESVLMEVEGIEPHYQIIVERKGALDELEVWVEVSEEIFPDAMRKLVEFEQKLENRLMQVIGLRAKVKLVEPKTVERTTGKAKRVIDKRKL